MSADADTLYRSIREQANAISSEGSDQGGQKWQHFGKLLRMLT